MSTGWSFRMNKRKICLWLLVIILFIILGIFLFKLYEGNTKNNVLPDSINLMYKEIGKNNSSYIVLNGEEDTDNRIFVDFNLGDFSYSDGYIVAIETSNYQGIYKINAEDGSTNMIISREEINNWAKDNGYEKCGSVYQPQISVNDTERVYFELSLDGNLYVCEMENSQIRILFETDSFSQYTVSGDKNEVYGVSDGNVICYDLVTGEKEIIVERPSDKWISINRDGTEIAYQDDGLYLYNVESKIKTKICDDERFTNKIVFSDDGKYMAYSVLHFGLFTTPDYGTLYVYNLQTGCIGRTIKLNNEGQTGYFDFF